MNGYRNHNISRKSSEVSERLTKYVKNVSKIEKLMPQEELRNSFAELQKHQELLKMSEERYRLVVEGVSDGLCDGDITADNMTKEISLQSNMKKDLRTAIEYGELFLCYQPLIDIKTKEIVCLEALLRWKHPRKGTISPMEFIPIAEETRLIIPIGEWVLQTACRQLKQWRDMGYTECKISVNVSIIQLQQPDFAETVIEILTEIGLPPEYLELEITESKFIESIQTVARNLNLLKKQGIKISIDDFGTGYCSFNYINKFAIDNLKIDRSFVWNIEADVNKAIIDTVISLGHKLNLGIIAEGVETKEQYDYLEMEGCDKVQGYYFSKPLLPEEVIEILKAGNI